MHTTPLTLIQYVCIDFILKVRNFANIWEELDTREFVPVRRNIETKKIVFKLNYGSLPSRSEEEFNVDIPADNTYVTTVFGYRTSRRQVVLELDNQWSRRARQKQQQ